MTTDQEQLHIRYRAEALCRDASLLRTRLRMQLTLLKAHHARLIRHRFRMRKLVREQHRMRAVSCSMCGWEGQTEKEGLTNLLLRLRGPYGL